VLDTPPFIATERRQSKAAPAFGKCVRNAEQHQAQSLDPLSLGRVRTPSRGAKRLV